MINILNLYIVVFTTNILFLSCSVTRQFYYYYLNLNITKIDRILFSINENIILTFLHIMTYDQCMIHKFNLALLAKQLWRLVQYPDRQWSSLEGNILHIKLAFTSKHCKQHFLRADQHFCCNEAFVTEDKTEDTIWL